MSSGNHAKHPAIGARDTHVHKRHCKINAWLRLCWSKQVSYTQVCLATQVHTDLSQDCQMVCFQNKKPNLGKFWRFLQSKMLVYYGHLVHFTVFWYILWTFGIFCGNLACKLFQFWYFVPRNIWQPWSKPHKQSMTENIWDLRRCSPILFLFF
jgi:hypothetical protein